MHKGLLRTLTYMYQFITLGRGTLTGAQLTDMAAAASTMAGTAPQILEPGEGENAEACRLDLAQAEIVEGHIEEMVSWITHLEIV